MKCGTTSLHHYLDMHPEIGMSSVKETDFFKTEENFDKGFQWYSSLFSDGFQVLGEASPNYTKKHLFPGVAQKIHTHLPDLKLIYMIRDPYKRFISHYVHRIIHGIPTSSLDDIFNDIENNEITLTGKYMWQLDEYRQYYPDENLLVLKSEDMKNDRVSALRKVFDFLGVDPGFKSEGFNNEFHKTQNKKKEFKAIRKLRRIEPLKRIVKKVMPVSFFNKIRGREIQRPELTKEQIKTLRDVYNDDIIRLQKFSGYDLSSWLNIE